MQVSGEISMKLLAALENRNKYQLILAGYILIFIIGLLDYFTGSELAFSVFYVIPIYLITFATNQNHGLIASTVSAITWFVADISTVNSYSSNLIPVWNTVIRLVFFILITYLLSSHKNSLRLAYTDFLTSAMNIRYFHEVVQMEIHRFQRYQRPFTIAYIDLDNFKTMNDRFGHNAGDEVLRILVRTIRNVIRKTDFIARLGGDEFAVLFPETEDESSRMICTKIRETFVEEMAKRRWTITFSVGVLTCKVAPHTSKELIRMADELMYDAKDAGKNTIKYSTYNG